MEFTTSSAAASGAHRPPLCRASFSAAAVRRFTLATVAALISLAAPLSPDCLAGGGPENVFLVVNSSSADSLAVANHYIDLRQIPASNVFYINYAGNKNRMPSETFRQKILRPVAREIQKRRLDSQIDYIVYSCDFPFRVRLEKDFPEVKFPVSFKPVASLTGATYLGPFIDNKRMEIFSPVTNFYAASDPGSSLTRSVGFRTKYHWAKGGKQVDSGAGLRYTLSAVLGVTYQRGNSAKEIIAYLKRARKADATHPQGTVYYVQNKTPRSLPRHGDFPAAVKQLQQAGVRAEIRQGVFLKGRTDIMGLTSGHHQLGVGKSQCRFLPGALCDNLTSAGAQFDFPKKPPGQTCVSEFLRLGAAGACGTVVEPTAMRQKFPMASMHLHYARGCSLAESFYQSVLCPYQQLLVGDPLCKPWATPPSISVAGIEEMAAVSGDLTIAPVAASASSPDISEFRLFVDGVFHSECQPGASLTLDTTELFDGYHQLRVVGIENSAIETQGRWVRGVSVKNSEGAVQISMDPAAARAGARQLKVKVATTGDGPIVVTHNGRELGQTAGTRGEIRIDLSKVGSGPVTLFAETSGKVKLRSRPLRFEAP